MLAVAERGVEVTILFWREANIGNDINHRTLESIWKECELRVFLSDQMIHSKLMMFDEVVVVTGSANLSVFSMQKAVELDLVIRENVEFIGAVKRAMAHRIGAARQVGICSELGGYNRFLATLQHLHQKIVG